MESRASLRLRWTLSGYAIVVGRETVIYGYLAVRFVALEITDVFAFLHWCTQDLHNLLLGSVDTKKIII